MGLLERMATVFKAKLTRLLDSSEDPRETMDYSYEKQREMLRDVKRGVVEVVTSRRRLELQEAQVQQNIAKLEEQARQALASGREDLARLALQRKQAALSQLQGLDAQIADLEQEQDKLTQAEARLATKVEAFRTRKEIIKAQYSSADAQVRIGEAMSGISEEFADVGLAIERAEEKTLKLKARASAIDELTATGVLEDVTGREDEIGRELTRITAGQNVEAELEAMKRQLPSGETKQLEAGR